MAHSNTSAGDSSPADTTPVRHPVSAPAGFGMPQALVITGFTTAAVVLHLVAHTSVQDTVALLSAVGGVSVAVLLAAGFHRGGGGNGLLRRLLRAVVTPSSGS
jgi:hypothetical protein